MTDIITRIRTRGVFNRSVNPSLLWYNGNTDAATGALWRCDIGETERFWSWMDRGLAYRLRTWMAYCEEETEG